MSQDLTMSLRMIEQWFRIGARDNGISKNECEPLRKQITDILAAHYEPVPEPPAQTCNCDVEMFGRHHDRCLYSVSEEQPAVARIAEEAKKCDCHPYPFTPAKADGTPIRNDEIKPEKGRHNG